MRHKLLIGRDILHTIDLKRDKVISPPSETSFESNREQSEIFQIDVVESRDVESVSNIRDEQYEGIIQNLINDYQPVKTRDVKMTILKDDELVYQ